MREIVGWKGAFCFWGMQAVSTGVGACTGGDNHTGCGDSVGWGDLAG